MYETNKQKLAQVFFVTLPPTLHNEITHIANSENKHCRYYQIHPELEKIDKTRTHLYSLKRNSPNSSKQIEAELTSELEAK